MVKAEFTTKSDTAKSGNKSGNGTTGSADDMLQIEYGSTGGLGSGSGGTGGGGAGAGTSASVSTEQGFHNHFVHSTSTKNDIGSRANTTIPPSTTNTSTHTTTTKSTTTTVPSILYTLLPVETEAGVHPVTLILNAFDPANAHDDDPNYFDELEVNCLR